MARKLTRRDFIKAGLLLGGGGAVALLAKLTGGAPLESGLAQSTNTQVFLPLVQGNPPTATPQPTISPTVVSGTGGLKVPGRVVRVHASAAHNWNYSASDYWNYVNQGVVDQMVNDGLMSLTGKGSVADAWRALIPNYQAGQIVAIKVSFNNTNSEAGSVGMIDGIAEPVNAIVSGLHQAGVPYGSIVIFDSSRVLPTRFTSKCIPGVQFRDTRDNPWGNASITFHPPATTLTQGISNVVANAAYLINVPILKRHGMSGLSLGLKNHYGTIQKPDDIHPWSSLASPDFSTTYSPITELNLHPHIAGKTILVVGDSVFAAFHNTGDRSFPVKWETFDNQSPKSLFFATDPVAIDCVMGDLLNEEFIAAGRGAIPDAAFAHLSLAAQAGLGFFERGNPWLNNYGKIALVNREL